MAKATDEEKGLELERIVECGKANHFFTMRKLLDSIHLSFTQSQLDYYIKKKYGETLMQYLLRTHALMTEEECKEYAKVLYQQVLKYSKNKPKIETLSLDGIEFGDVDMVILQRFWEDPDEPERMTLARRLALDGVLKMPFETEEERKQLIEQSIVLTKEEIISRAKFEHHNLGWISYYQDKYVFLDKRFLLELPKCDFFGYYTVEFKEPYEGKRKVDIFQESVLQWIQEIYSTDLRTFYEHQGILCTKEDLQAYFQKQIEAWKLIIKETGKQKDIKELELISEKLLREAVGLEDREKVPKNPRPALKLALGRNIPSMNWMSKYVQEYVLETDSEEKAWTYLERLFIREGILQNEEEVQEMTRLAALKHDIYEDIDRFDVEPVLNDLGIIIKKRVLADGKTITSSIEGFPKDESFEVRVDEKIFTVQFKLKRKVSELCLSYTFWWERYDAYEAISTMLTVDEEEEVLLEKYPSSDAFAYATPQFKEGLTELPKEIIWQRKMFLIAVAALLETPEMAQKIAEYAPKKKDGTFYRNRVIRIANSRLAEWHSTTLGISARTKSDSLILVSIESLGEEPNELKTLQEDFINSNQDLFGFAKWLPERK